MRVALILTIVCLVAPAHARNEDPCPELGAKVRARPASLRVNTSNPGKRREFERLFTAHGQTLEFTSVDLSEIDADPILVIAHKASQFPSGQHVIVEDTMLAVEGADIGVNIRWMLEEAARLSGRKAVWTVHLAYRDGDRVRIYKGEVHGHIVAARGAAAFAGGFDAIFLPDGETQTLAENKPDRVNARAKAIDALLTDHGVRLEPALVDWTGKWQHAH